MKERGPCHVVWLPFGIPRDNMSWSNEWNIWLCLSPLSVSSSEINVHDWPNNSQHALSNVVKIIGEGN